MRLTNGCFYKAGFRLAGIRAVASSVHSLHSEHTVVSCVQPVTYKPTNQSSTPNQLTLLVQVDSIKVNM